MIKAAIAATKQLIDGHPEISPVKLTAIQSGLVVIVASVLAAGLFELVGIYFHSVWYQLFATLVIASIVAPIFLYPTFKTSQRLRDANAIIEKQATTDYLTGLPNMLAFASRLETALLGVNGQNGFALHFVDLDRFKQINDSLGHDGGNALLKAAAIRLSNWVGTAGFVARFGGDEFVIIQFNGSNDEDVSNFALEMRSIISTSYEISGQDITVGATVGSALGPIHGNSHDQLLIAADMALYKAKDAGRTHYLFDPSLAVEVKAKNRIEGILRSAIKNNQCKPHFHSIVRTDNPLRIVGFEALARIELPDGEILRPDDFIPVAESTGMILELGETILRKACIECARWHTELFVAVNVSPVQLMRSDFLKTVKEALEDSGLPANRLELEITESVLIDDVAYIGPILSHLRNLGVRIALDDFGAGYCGLHYLRQITIDKIKIDKSIIDDAGKVQVATNILRSVSHFAQDLGLTVTAEGVDNIAKAEFLARENCAQELQGYLFSRPVTAREAFRMQDDLSHKHTSNSEIVSLNDFARSRHTR